MRAFFRGVDLAHVFSARDVASRKQVPLIKKHTTDGPGNALRQLKELSGSSGTWWIAAAASSGSSRWSRSVRR